MKTRSRAVVVVLITLTLATAAGARDGAAPPAPKATGPQEVEVVAVALDPRTQTPAVLLEGKRDKRHLMMVIGPAEATGIAVPLQGVTPPRPLTHDLFLTLFGRLRVTVTKVVITDLRDDIYYATVYLDASGKEMQLDSRPSDAIALAIRAKAPVFAEDRVFDKSERLLPPSTSPPGQRI
jgi:bifunctional DNase/RNase